MKEVAGSKLDAGVNDARRGSDVVMNDARRDVVLNDARRDVADDVLDEELQHPKIVYM